LDHSWRVGPIVLGQVASPGPSSEFQRVANEGSFMDRLVAWKRPVVEYAALKYDRTIRFLEQPGPALSDGSVLAVARVMRCYREGA
jgi:hypothetical protein